MREGNLKKLVYSAIMTALIAIGTMIVQIPTPATKGYINVGDSFIFLAAAIFGPALGFVTGGLGSGLADLLSGYAYWAPWTFIIKGLEGLVVALIFKKYNNIYLKAVSLIAGAVWMVLGYYIAGGIMYGFKASLADVPGNVIQGIASIIIGSILINVISRIKLLNDI